MGLWVLCGKLVECRAATKIAAQDAIDEPGEPAVVHGGCRVDRLIDDNHPARKIWRVVEKLDLSRFETQVRAVEGVAGRPSRHFASGIIALRPDRDGRIRGYSGVEDIHRQFGRWVVDSHLPAPGTPTQPIEAGYMANAWIRMRHPDYDELRSMLDAVGQTVHVYAG